MTVITAARARPLSSLSFPISLCPRLLITKRSDRDGGGGSPVLFFVALGFGVGFILIWSVSLSFLFPAGLSSHLTFLFFILRAYDRVAIGARYCFRHRRRAAYDDGLTDDVMAIDLFTTAPQQPRRHRRRREKKLMTMDEVNDQFPLMKYKVWRSDRASKGLPTSGGISVPPSRAPSIKGEKDSSMPTVEIIEDVDAELPSPLPTDTSRVSRSDSGHLCSPASPSGYDSTVSSNQSRFDKSSVLSSCLERLHLQGDSRGASHPERRDDKDVTLTSIQERPSYQSQRSRRSHVPITSADSSPNARPHSDNGDSETDEPIHHAVMSECTDVSGDVCAICLDVIDDEDDIRGLKCDHTFHASCIDPWLTSRRACCPLCKADYYVPKPRPEGVTEPEPVAVAVTATSPGRPARPARRMRLRENSIRYQPSNGNSTGPAFPTLLLTSHSHAPALHARQASDEAHRQYHQQYRSRALGERLTPHRTDTAAVQSRLSSVGAEAPSRPSRSQSIRRSLRQLRNLARSRSSRDASGLSSTPRHGPSPGQLESGEAHIAVAAR
ncbi:hypothetical protein KEM52_001480 [Ascosphaera acerosa]|nr:hypothetical protein KEM52_001480 [Ascosphaera acerosa]